MEKVSRAAAERLSQYLRSAPRLADDDGMVSSVDLAKQVGVSAAQVRRDLAAIGHVGHRGIGYAAATLTAAVRTALGVDRRWRVVLVGAGNLGRALIGYRGFAEHGFDLVGVFDADPAKAGGRVDGLDVMPLSKLRTVVEKARAEMGVLAVPATAAQGVADELIAAGVRGLMNFAPVRLKLPPHVAVIPVDLAVQLEQLAFAVRLGDG